MRVFAPKSAQAPMTAKVVRSNDARSRPHGGQSAASMSPRFGSSFSRVPVHSPASAAVQLDLAVSRAGHEHELEADRVSERVMRMPDPHRQQVSASSDGCLSAKAERLRRERPSTRPGLARSCDLGTGVAPSVVRQVLRSPGQPLEPAVRGSMERRFGYDFSRVRVHADAPAARAAMALDAAAFTVGHHVAFAESRYRLGSEDGIGLLAHEFHPCRPAVWAAAPVF